MMESGRSFSAACPACGAPELELMVTLGRDSQVAYQNAASKMILVRPIGTSLLGIVDFFNAEEIRDKVFSGQTVRYHNEELQVGERRIWVTRTYHPLIDDEGRIVGILSQGSSFRTAPQQVDAPGDLKRLLLNFRRFRAIRGWR